MLTQIIKSVEFETGVGGLTPRFGPLINSSHRKELIKQLEKIVDSKWIETEAAGNPDKLTREGIAKSIMDNQFLTLNSMNIEGWRLESFASILDDNRIPLQVAIFSRITE